jgi:hypothetical protein
MLINAQMPFVRFRVVAVLTRSQKSTSVDATLVLVALIAHSGI